MARWTWVRPRPRGTSVRPQAVQPDSGAIRSYPFTAGMDMVIGR